jgi:hypothetical protein
LKVFSNIAPQSTDRIVQIIGNEEQAISTLVEIIELIKSVSIFIGVHVPAKGNLIKLGFSFRIDTHQGPNSQLRPTQLR